MENNLEEVKQEIFKTIDNYYNEYKLPPQSISDKEWNTFFHVIESHFLAHNQMQEYVHALNIVVRRALYFAQVTMDKEFTVEHLKHALTDLTAFRIPTEEIKAMEEEIDDNIKKYTK